ncbi:MAG: hypothetical protein Q9170_005719 [Blastenia crenularia]
MGRNKRSSPSKFARHTNDIVISISYEVVGDFVTTISPVTTIREIQDAAADQFGLDGDQVSLHRPGDRRALKPELSPLSYQFGDVTLLELRMKRVTGNAERMRIWWERLEADTVASGNLMDDPCEKLAMEVLCPENRGI